MTSDEVWDLLELISSIDRRKVGLTDRKVWEGLIGDLPAADAQAAVITHYRDSREWIMPSDVRTEVRRVRNERIKEAGGVPAPPPELLDDPPAYRAALRAAATALADGRDPQEAMQAIARQSVRLELEAS